MNKDDFIKSLTRDKGGLKPASSPRLSTLEPMERDDFVRVAKERFKMCVDMDFENRTLAKEDVLFMEGRGQWSDEVKERYRADGRPILTINKLPSFADQVKADIRNNKMSIKVNPVDDISDPKTAKVFAGLIKNIEMQSKAEQVYLHAGDSAIDCGFGGMKINTKYADENSFDQEIVIDHIKNQFSFYLDPFHEKIDGSDANYGFIFEDIERQAFEEQWPDVPLASIEGNTNNYAGWFTAETVKVAEYYWKEISGHKTVYLLSSGDVLDSDLHNTSKETFKTLDDMGLYKLQERKVDKIKVMRAIVNGTDILEGPDEWPGSHIPIIPVYGKEVQIEGRTIRRGIVRNAKDSQRMYNYFRSTITETLALQPKAPYLATPEQVEGFEHQWEGANRKNYSVIYYNDIQGAPKPQREPPPMASQSMFAEAATVNDDMRATTGVTEAKLGLRSNEVSGVAIAERRRESDLANFVYSDNLRMSVEYLARQVVELIPKVYNTSRIIRILGDDGSSDTIKINEEVFNEKTGELEKHDLKLGKYDVEVSVGPAFDTMRLESLQHMIDIAGKVPHVFPIIADLVVGNMDFKDSAEMARRLKLVNPLFQNQNQGQSPEDPENQEQTPEEQTPEGQPPEGQPPEGMPPQGQPPQGQPPQGQPPQGQPPQGQPTPEMLKAMAAQMGIV